MHPSPNVHHFISRPAAVLKVAGQDALTFLQGQFTQELRGSSEHLAAYGLWLNQKGKVLADSFALRDGAEWWLVSLTSPAFAIRDRLEAYIIADDVQIEDRTAEWNAVVLTGTGVDEALRFVDVALPAAGAWVPAQTGMLFRGRDLDGAASWVWLLPYADAAALARASQGSPLSEESWHRLRLRSGVPAIPTEFGPGDLPNEAALESEAISYTKGCYLGQEVMARLKSMGQVRRRLVRIRASGPISPLPAPLYSGAKKVGEVRAAVRAEAPDQMVGLAMVSLLGLEVQQPLSLVPETPPTVRITEPGARASS